MDDGVAGTKYFKQWLDELRAQTCGEFSPIIRWPLHGPVARCCHINAHLRVDPSATQSMMDAISRAGRTAVNVGVVEVEDFHDTL